LNYISPGSLKTGLGAKSKKGAWKKTGKDRQGLGRPTPQKLARGKVLLAVPGGGQGE